MNAWIVAIFVVMLYIQLFNVIARMYFDSGSKMTWFELYRKIVPPFKIEL